MLRCSRPRQSITRIDPDGKEHRTPWGDDYPHDHIMEILQDYKAKDFKVKKGLFGWKLVEK